MSDINTAIQTHPPTPEKSQSQFLWGKNRVCEHFSHNRVFWVFRITKNKLTARNRRFGHSWQRPQLLLHRPGIHPCYTIRITMEIPEHISSYFYSEIKRNIFRQKLSERPSFVFPNSNGIFSRIILSNIQF